MTRKTLLELGWESRRLNILMPIKEWQKLEAYARRTDAELGVSIAVYAMMWVNHIQGLDRVSLTPEGEQVADGPHADLEDHKLGTGGAEW